MYPQKVNAHIWNTVKPVLSVEEQLMPDKKAQQRSTDSALPGEHPCSRDSCVSFVWRELQCPSEPGGVTRLKNELTSIYRVNIPLITTDQVSH